MLDEAALHFQAALKLRPDDEILKRLVADLKQRRAMVVSSSNLPAVPARSVNGNGKYHSRPTVLVVDDSPTIRKLVAMTLTRGGYQVSEAIDGHDALELIQETGPPHLILVNVGMADSDGYDLCRTLRKQPQTRKLPIVMLSDRDREGFFNKMRGLMAGSAQFLIKPFQPEALLKVVQEHLCVEGGG